MGGMTILLWVGAWAAAIVAARCVRGTRRLLVLWVVAVLSIYPLIDLWRRPDAGWDLALLCSGFEAWQSGADPYDLADLRRLTGSELALPYPAFWIVALHPLCLLPGDGAKWAQLFMLAAVYLLLPRRSGDGPLSLALLLGGLAALYWNVLTGNHGLVELMLIALFYRHAAASRLGAAGAALGLLGSFKLLPALYSLALLGWWRAAGPRRVGLALAASLVAFTAVHAVSWVIAPALYQSFLAQTFGFGRQWPVPLLETTASLTNPTPWLCVAGLPDGRIALPKSAALLAGLVAALLIPLRRFARETALALGRTARSATSGTDGALRLASWMIVLLVLLSPRLKPYAYAHLLAPLWWLARELRPGCQLAIAVTAVAPATLLFVLVPRWLSPGSEPFLVASIPALSAIATAILCGYGRRVPRVEDGRSDHGPTCPPTETTDRHRTVM